MRRYVFGLAMVGCVALAPLAARGDDQQIAEAVMQRLGQEKQAGNLRGFGIELQVDDGSVTMKGRVSSPDQEKLALECAQYTHGVTQVVNELVVSQRANVKQVAQSLDARGSSRLSAAPAQMRPAPYPMNSQVPARQAVNQMPRAFAPAQTIAMRTQGPGMPAGPAAPQYMPGSSGGVTPAQYDHPQMPGYAWPAYASHPNYAAVTYPKQYSPTAWPYIGPFYPYPQVPLGWRKVTLEWDDGWWMLDFKDTNKNRH